MDAHKRVMGKGAKGLRERCGSVGSVEEMLKRKREDLKEDGREEWGDIFKRSNKTGRSPEQIGDKVEGTVGEMMAVWRREMEEVIREMREVKEGIKEQGGELRREMEEMRREFREQERRWIEERGEMRRSIRSLEEKVEVLEKKKLVEGGGEEKGEEIEKRLRGMERKIELREREERKRNFLIKGLVVKEGKRKEAVEEIFKILEVKADIEEVKRIGGEGEREMAVVRMSSEEQKKEVMRKKWRLKGRKEIIMEDWTWGERKMRWKLEEIAKKEEREGKKVSIGYGKIKIGEQWWRWDEREEVLRDGKGNVRGLSQGECEKEGKDGLV